MAFASIFIPDFMLQAVVRSEPALRDRAVAIVDGTAPVWSVVGLNEAAAKAGITIGMTKSQAQQFCGMEIRHRSPAREKATHAALLDLGWSLSPRVEDTAPDTLVVDLAGLNSLFGPNETIANRLTEHASRLGLLAYIAVASQIETAIVAARGFPGVTVIPDGTEAEILGRLPVNALCPSLEVLETLECWGVRRCADLAALPVLQLSERLGQEGVRLHDLAQGRGERAMVVADRGVHFEEEMELEDAVEELEPLSFLLGRLIGQLCARLETRSLAACAVRVRFELDPSFEADVIPGSKGEPQSTQRKTGGHREGPQNRRRRGEDGIRNDPSRLPKNYERVLTLPTPVRNPKTLLNLLRLHLQSDPPAAPILRIVMSADAARPRVAQAGLFRPISPDPEKLELTIARLANVVGDTNVGSPELVDTHRPEEFRMRRFVADVPDPRQGYESKDGDGKHAEQKRSAQAFRVFRPAPAAKVDLCEERPARVRFQGMDGCVVAASGPWRSSGDWWREDGWQNDEWDLEIVFSSVDAHANATSGFESPTRAAASVTRGARGFYRIFFDSIRKEWFVRGEYD
jgi:protein ImuB